MYIFVQMSSDEDEPTSPVLHKDSDRGSSVSSDLQVIIRGHITLLTLCVLWHIARST